MLQKIIYESDLNTILKNLIFTFSNFPDYRVICADDLIGLKINSLSYSILPPYKNFIFSIILKKIDLYSLYVIILRIVRLDITRSQFLSFLTERHI